MNPGIVPPIALTEVGVWRYAKVRADAIHHEVVRVAALPVHAEVTHPFVLQCEHYARRQRDQRLEGSPIQQHVVHEHLAYHGAGSRRVSL